MAYYGSFKQMSPELVLLLNCTKSNYGDEEKIHSLIFPSINWDLFLELARHHRVFSLVYKALSSLNNQAVPEYVLHTLQQEYRKMLSKLSP